MTNPYDALNWGLTPLDRMLHMKNRTNLWLGRQIGCNDTQISRYRHGKHIPTLERQIKICRVLDCDLSDLWPVAELTEHKETA